MHWAVTWHKEKWSVLQGLPTCIAGTVIISWQSSTWVHHWVMSLSIFIILNLMFSLLTYVRFLVWCMYACKQNGSLLTECFKHIWQQLWFLQFKLIFISLNKQKPLHSFSTLFWLVKYNCSIFSWYNRVFSRLLDQWCYGDRPQNGRECLLCRCSCRCYCC